MEFNSQICTSIEQSEKLLALGLKGETADMSISTRSFDTDNGIKYSLIPYSECKYRIMYNVIPAWSLHRLIEMMPTIVNPVRNLFVSNKSVEYQMSEGRTTHMFTGENNVYDNIINCIEWLIGLGKFNENYLNCAE